MSGLGGVLLVVRRGLRQHLVSTVVTMASVALSTGLIMTVFQASRASERAFTESAVPFDAVYGARGSPVQLVLNTVFHLETSPGNVTWAEYLALRDDPRVAAAVPMALGDSYRGHRVVGTTPEMFSVSTANVAPLAVVAGGRIFDPTLAEAVVGSVVAARTGLSVGSVFAPTHGLEHDGHTHEEEYLVVGVLEPTNTPVDRVVWIPIEGVFRMGGHVLRGAGETFVARQGEEIPDEHREVSAVMLQLRAPMHGFSLASEINGEEKKATLAWPIGQVMLELFDKIGWVSRVLAVVAVLVVAVAGASILASIYASMNERRRDFAILRALGARRRTVFAVIVLEATAIAALGALVGLAVHVALMAGVASMVREQTGIVLGLSGLHPALWATPLGMVLVGALAGVLPAWRAYRTDVVAGLAPQS